MKNKTEFVRSEEPISRDSLEPIVSEGGKNITKLDIKIFEWTEKDKEKNIIFLGPKNKDPQTHTFEYFSETIYYKGTNYHLHPSIMRQK